MKCPPTRQYHRRRQHALCALKSQTAANGSVWKGQLGVQQPTQKVPASAKPGPAAKPVASDPFGPRGLFGRGQPASPSKPEESVDDGDGITIIGVETVKK